MVRGTNGENGVANSRGCTWPLVMSTWWMEREAGPHLEEIDLEDLAVGIFTIQDFQEVNFARM